MSLNLPKFRSLFFLQTFSAQFFLVFFNKFFAFFLLRFCLHKMFECLNLGFRLMKSRRRNRLPYLENYWHVKQTFEGVQSLFPSFFKHVSSSLFSKLIFSWYFWPKNLFLRFLSKIIGIFESKCFHYPKIPDFHVFFARRKSIKSETYLARGRIKEIPCPGWCSAPQNLPWKWKMISLGCCFPFRHLLFFFSFNWINSSPNQAKSLYNFSHLRSASLFIIFQTIQKEKRI